MAAQTSYAASGGLIGVKEPKTDLEKAAFRYIDQAVSHSDWDASWLGNTAYAFFANPETIGTLGFGAAYNAAAKGLVWGGRAAKTYVVGQDAAEAAAKVVRGIDQTALKNVADNIAKSAGSSI